MGRSKEWPFEMEAERQAKQEALLDAPQLIEAGNVLIQHLRDELVSNSETIDDIRQQIAFASSLKSKAVDYFIGGLVGALIGLLF